MDIEDVARLARLQFNEAEKARIGAQLGAILNYIDKLSKLPTEGVEPTSHAMPIVSVMRDDELRPCLSQEDALANAPDRVGEFFRVPRILED